MRPAELMVQAEEGSLRVGRHRVPLELVEDVTAEEISPSLRCPALGLVASVLSIPLLHALPIPDSWEVLTAFAAVGVIALASIFQLVFGSEAYAVVLSLAGGEKRTVLRSGDHRLVVSVVAEVHEMLQPRTSEPFAL